MKVERKREVSLMTIFQDPSDTTLIFGPSEVAYPAPVQINPPATVAHPVWMTFDGEWIQDNGEW
jgi:hypothetical protein